MWGGSVFLGVSHAPIPRGQNHCFPKIGTLTWIHTVRETITKFCMAIEEKFYTVDHECWRAICLSSFLIRDNFLRWYCTSGCVDSSVLSFSRNICHAYSWFELNSVVCRCLYDMLRAVDLTALLPLVEHICLANANVGGVTGMTPISLSIYLYISLSLHVLTAIFQVNLG